LSRWRRIGYRIYRNPIVLFGLGPAFLFLLQNRVPINPPRAGWQAWLSPMTANLAILAVGLSLLFGLKAYLIIQLTTLAVAGSVGFWLFYVQHQFEGVYWERGDEWEYTAAALQGSSFYKLPKILQWFSGNIGYHHIHHLSSRIPNYNLERCHRAHLMFQQVKPLTLFSSLQSLRFRLWDEPRKKLVGYRHLRDLRKQQKRSARP